MKKAAQNTQNEVITLETIKGFAKVAQVGSTYMANGIEFTVLNKLTSVETEGKGALILTSLSDEPMRYEKLSKTLGIEWIKETREDLGLSNGKVLNDEELEKAKLDSFTKFDTKRIKLAKIMNDYNELLERYKVDAGASDDDIKEAISLFHNANNELAKQHAQELAEKRAIKKAMEGKSKSELAKEQKEYMDENARLRAKLLELGIEL